MQRLRVRIASLFVLALVVGCADEHPPLPPPPAEATASCVYEQTQFGNVTTSTLWFNSLDQVIRVDGLVYEDDGTSYLAPTYVHYDAEGRVSAQEGPFGAFTWTYSPDQIVGRGQHNRLMQLVDGRVVHAEFFTELAPNQREYRDYTYDGDGRIASYSQQTMKYDATYDYTYDETGRLVGVNDHSFEPLTTLTYTNLDLQLKIDVAGYKPQRWVLDFDEDQRLVRTEQDMGDFAQTFNYVYSDGVIEGTLEGGVDMRIVATGRCDPPALRTAPALPVATWEAIYARLLTPTEFFVNAVLR